MQDKPDLQEELSARVSCLIHSFHTIDHQFLYFETFLQTLKREWNGIDRLRMDKYFQLVRFVFRQVFEILKRRNWESSLISHFLAVFTAQLLQSTRHVPDGLMLHILELYMTELAHVGSAELTAEQNLTFIDPFCRTMGETRDHSLLIYISKHIFSTILDHASYAVQDLMKELSHGKEDSDSGQASEEEEISIEKGIPKVEKCDEGSEDELLDMDNVYPEENTSDDFGPVLQFDYGAIADRLFELGSRQRTPNFNRTKMYKLVKTFRDLSGGIFPQDDCGDDTAVKHKDWSLNKSKKKRRNEAQANDKSSAKKCKACEDVQTLSKPDQVEELSSENIKKKKKDDQAPEADAERSTETTRSTLDTPVEAGGILKGKNKREQLAVDTKSQSQFQDYNDLQSELEPGARRKRKSKKFNLQRIVEEAAEKCDAYSEGTDEEHTNINKEVRKCLDPETIEKVDSETQQTTAAPSGWEKSVKKSKKHIKRNINAFTPVKKKQKQDCATVDKVTVIFETSPRVTGWPEGAVSRKKIKAIDEEKPEADNIKIVRIQEESHSSDQTGIASDTIVKQQSDAIPPTMKKKDKRRKVKEMAVHINTLVKVEVKKPEVAIDEPTGKGDAHNAVFGSNHEKWEPKFESERKLEADDAYTTCTPKKKTQKKQKRQLVHLTKDVNEESQSADTTEKLVMKTSKQKQKAKAETPETDYTPLTKGKKKRKMQADEAQTSLINGQTVKEGLEILTSVMPKKKTKKASSESDFASFQGQTKAPMPLFCKVKPKGCPSAPLSSLKTLRTPKSDTKKVTFGLKNNKTAEFRKTDQSLLVSPVGSSRVAFDPQKKPTSSVLKSPMSSPSVSLKKTALKKRATAADFF
ncbi:uncharacterized protein [Salminus brasiliensis]